MFDNKFLTNFERLIIEENTIATKKDFIKSHYRTILQMANPLIVEKKIVLNEYQLKLMFHLFKISQHVEYIPSFFIKEIAELSIYLNTLEASGIFSESKSSAKTEFFCHFYKTVSMIMKNKFIKSEKKNLFEKIISQRLIENSVNWLILFTQPKIVVEPNVKLNLKAITQTKFEFFETFAVNFKRTIYDLISNCSSKSQEKNFINKYVFKIIEKCLIKLNNVEKEFLVKLNKISHNLIDLFLKTRSKKLKKLFRRCLRIVYIIYDRQGYSNSKIIKLFKNKFFPLLIFPSDVVTKEFIDKILFDFIEVNFTILNKKVDLIDYYYFYYSLLLNEDPETKEKYISDVLMNKHFESFLSCNEKLFKYEMSAKNQIYDASYVKLLHNLFNTFFSDSVNENKKQISIEIICRILRNCQKEMKISILEEISFSHISFFMEDSNCFLLENVINSVMQNLKCQEIYGYFIKYMDMLFIHSLKGNYLLTKFLDILNDLIDKIESEQIFYLTLSYCKKFFLHLQNEGRLVNINIEEKERLMQNKSGKLTNQSKNQSNQIGSVMINNSANNLNILNNQLIEINGFLKILATTSHSIKNRINDLLILQEILDCYSIFLIIKIFNFSNIDFSYKFNLESYHNSEIKEFAFYFLIFAKNLPAFVFNKNTYLSSPVKIEINFILLNLLEEKRKIISDEFEDFGENVKKSIRDLDTVSQLYLLGIYISFVAKYVFLNIFCNSDPKEKQLLQSKIDLNKIATTKISLIDMLDYLTDNLFLHEKNMHDLFEKIFDKYITRYIDLLKKYHNTLFKQQLLSHDLRILLNYSCFYNESVREVALEIISRYTMNYPFLLNEYEIFEYYVTILGILTSHSLSPYEFFIRRINLNKYVNDERESNDILELPSEKYEKEKIYLKLSQIFEQCLQKSHIINNNNISYNIANYVNKCSFFVLNSNLLECQELNYSINLLQKIYNNIKKVEISSFLKTTAYLDPKGFEDYLNENVYKNFDKYLTLSSINDIYSFTDYAKSTILQIRNKYMGVIEGKVHNLRNNYNNDSLFKDYKNLFSNHARNNDEIINNYCYYKIMNDISLKLQKTFKENDIKIINREIFPILLELTSFIVFADMNEFKTSFNKEIITDEIVNMITCIPIFLANSYSIAAGNFCWEWILYLNKKKLTSLLNNIILSVKFMKQHKSYFIKIYNTEKIEKKDEGYLPIKSEIFDVENNISEEFKNKKIEQFEATTLKELKASVNYPKNKKNLLTNYGDNQVITFYNGNYIPTFNYENYYYRFGYLSLVNLTNERVLTGKEIDLNDYISSQINLLKFVKECMNEICKCEIEKLVLIFNLLKLFVDLSIDHNLYSQPLYIYLHFLIFNISIELIDILNGKIHLFPSEIKLEDISEFKIVLYLFGFRYFEFNKQRRMITDVVLLSEIEQTLINCVQVIIKDKDNKENYEKIKNRKASNLFRKKKKDLSRVYTFVYSIESKLKEIGNLSDGFVVYENIKDLLIYLIESEINNLRYWNSPSTFHNNKKYTPSSSKFKADKVKNIFFSAFSISNKLSIKLVQRFPWIEKKFSSYIDQLSLTIYENRKLFYGQPQALRYIIDYISKNSLHGVENLSERHRKDFIMWKYPTLNYALKYISPSFDKKFIMNRYAIMLLNNAKTSAIIFYMPQLIQSLKTETNNMIEKFILSKCKESTKIAHQFLWSLEVEEIMGPKSKHKFSNKNQSKVNVFEIVKHLRLKILKAMNPMQRKFWYDENLVFSKITLVSSKFLHINENPTLSLKMSKEEKTEFVRAELNKIPRKMPDYIYLPTNPDTKILEVIPNSAVSLQSAKKVPFIVSFVSRKYEGPDLDPFMSFLNIAQFEREELFPVEQAFRPGANISGSIILDVNAQNVSKILLSKSLMNTEERGLLTMNNLKISSANFIQNLPSEESNKMAQIDDDNIVNEEQEDIRNLIVPHLDIKIFNKYDGEVKKSFEVDVMNDLEEEKNGEMVLHFDDSNVNVNDLSGCTNEDIEEEISNQNEQKKKSSRKCTEDLYGMQKLEHENRIIKYAKTNNYDYENKNISCIFKVGDDLRQDSLALQVIHIFKEIFKENNLKVFVYPYQTISTITSEHKDLGGFIEVVQDCDSRDQIGKTYDTDLYNYFVCTFGQEDSNEFREARKNFIESLAAYAIISYILQIKDRHNGNILVDKFGHIIHIDFGFIFDISPAGNMKFEKPAFKLTKEMIQIMQGTHSEPYATFVDLTIRGFLACRDYMEKLLDPVVLMFNSGLDCFRENSIRNFIERFKLELNEDEAANFMKGLISDAENNWRTNFYDFIQKKQNNIHY